MALTAYLPGKNPVSVSELRTERILYGSDFPNIPYAWDRELKELEAHFPDDRKLERILGRNAAELFSISLPDRLPER